MCRKPVSPHECPAPPPFARTLEIGTYYIDSHASIIDATKLAAFQKASEDTTLLSRNAALAADAYLDKGSRAAPPYASIRCSLPPPPRPTDGTAR